MTPAPWLHRRCCETRAPRRAEWSSRQISPAGISMSRMIAALLEPHQARTHDAGGFHRGVMHVIAAHSVGLGETTCTFCWDASSASVSGSKNTPRTSRWVLRIAPRRAARLNSSCAHCSGLAGATGVAGRVRRPASSTPVTNMMSSKSSAPPPLLLPPLLAGAATSSEAEALAALLPAGPVESALAAIMLVTCPPSCSSRTR